jgi:TRAP-type transport system periplasmic protein
MKKSLMAVIALMMVAVLIMAGCASSPSTAPSTAPNPAPAPTSSGSPASTSAPSPSASAKPAPAAAKIYKFAVAVDSPEQSWVSSNALRPWLKQITDVTKGQVTFDVYYNSTLCKPNQTWQATQNGVADVALVSHAGYPGLTPLTEIVTLPFLQLDTAKKNSTLLWKMYEKYPSISNEFKVHHVLVLWNAAPSFLSTSKKQVVTMEDLKGLRIKGGGALPVTQAFQAMGVAPIVMAAGDTYLNLQKGVVDGAMVNWDFLSSFKLYEVQKYYAFAPFQLTNFSLIMNQDKWNGLPKDIQDQINSISGLNASQWWGNAQFDSAEAPTRESIKKQGFAMVETIIAKSEVDKMISSAGKPAWDSWVQDMTKAGHPEVKEMLTSMQEIGKTIQ